MKRFLTLFIIVLMAVEMKAQAPFQSRPTAYTVDNKTFEFALFAPTRYGFCKNTEVFSSVLADWKLPNIGIKRLWFTKEAKRDDGFFRSRRIYFGTLHNFDYPKMFFETVQDKKPKLIADTCVVPNVLTMKNEARATILLKNKTSCDAGNFLLTVRAGVKNSFKLSKDATMPPINKALWYRESVVCLDTIVWFVGADLDIHFNDRLNILVDADFYSVDWDVKAWSGENKVFVYGYCGQNRRILAQAGFKVDYGTVFGDFKTLLLPMIDISYFFAPRKAREKGLFDKKMF